MLKQVMAIDSQKKLRHPNLIFHESAIQTYSNAN